MIGLFFSFIPFPQENLLIILASDIGSTTTKVVVFKLSGGAFTAVASVQEPTTV